MKASLLAFLLVLSLLPTMEVVEAAVHLVEHGDMAHGSHEDASDLGADEHGCSGSFHLCGSTTSMIAPHAIVAPRSLELGASVGTFTMDRWVGLGASAPPIRPPIA